MTVTRLDGLRTTPLASYLAAIGLARVLAEQADTQLRLWWSDDVAHVDSCVDDIARWLVDAYRPTPVVSPWNEGSGYGRKDKKPRVTLRELIERDEPRLAVFRAAHEAAAAVGAAGRTHGWSKERTVRELRNRCPDDLLEWIDASVVLAGDKAVFPPLLGTGGNDGRLDFSTNFHQRLQDVLDDQPAGRARSLRWARDALHGTQGAPLQPAAMGQFSPLAGGGRNSSVFGAADSLVNPWTFVLLVEGSLLYASGVSRRLGTAAHASSQAAMPFSVRTAADDLGAGAADEESRGEVWSPVWQEPMAWSEVQQLFREARASWRGRVATGAVQMYEATRSLGVARGVDRFVRYGLHQRNGLAFVAVPLDTVDVVQRPDVRLAEPIEDWLDRARRAASSSAVARALRQAEQGHLAFARNGGGRALVDLLAAATRVELAVGRSSSAAEVLAVSHGRIRAADYLDVVYRDSPTPEVRLAASIAAAACPDPDSDSSSRALREVVLPLEPRRGGRPPAWARSRVEGFGARPLVDVLADAMVWRSQHWSSEEKTVGLVPWPYSGVHVPARDVQAWLNGELDESEIERHVTAFLSLDWDRVRAPWASDAPDEVGYVPDPLLTMLQAFRSGVLRRPGQDDVRVGLALDWPVRLRSGHGRQVAAEAVAALRRCGWTTAVPRLPAHAGGARTLAALVPASAHVLRELSRVADSPRFEDSAAPPSDPSDHFEEAPA